MSLFVLSSSGYPSSGGIPILSPLLGFLIGCFRISLPRRFITTRLSDLILTTWYSTYNLCVVDRSLRFADRGEDCAYRYPGLPWSKGADINGGTVFPNTFSPCRHPSLVCTAGAGGISPPTSTRISARTKRNPRRLPTLTPEPQHKMTFV